MINIFIHSFIHITFLSFSSVNTILLHQYWGKWKDIILISEKESLLCSWRTPVKTIPESKHFKLKEYSGPLRMGQKTGLTSEDIS